MKQRPTDGRRLRSHRLGMFAELVGAGCLILRGYRIRGRRERTPYGEVDVIAVRGRRLAFVEVKYRPSIDEGMTAVEASNADRIAAAAEHWVAGHRRFADHDLGFDAVVVVPWRWPVYLRDVLQPIGTNARAGD